MSRFQKYMIAGSIWTAAGFILPVDIRGISYVLGATVVVLYLHSVARTLDEPVRSIIGMVTIAGGISVAGVIVRAIHGMIIGEEFPIPSPADVLTFMTYPLFIIALIRIVRCRVGRIDIDLAIDALLGGAAAAIAHWALLIHPLLTNPNISRGEVMVDAGYAVMGTCLMMAAVMLFVAGSHRSMSNRLLGVALMLTFLMDSVGTAMTSIGRDETIVLYIAPIVYTLAGAGIVHPSINLITSRPTDQRTLRRMSNKRISVMAIALLIPPTLLFAFVILGSYGRLLVPSLGSIILATLVLIRLGRLVRQNAEIAELQVKLRVISERLLASETESEAFASLEYGAVQLLGVTADDVVFIPVESEQTDIAGSTTGSMTSTRPRRTTRAIDERIDQLLMGDVVADVGELIELESGRSHYAVAGVVKVRQNVRGVLVVSADHALSTTAEIAIATICREVAMALRAVEHTERRVRKRSEARFESLVSNSSDILAVLDPQFQLVYVSSAADRLMGFPVADHSLANLTKTRESGSDAGELSGTVLDLVRPDHRPMGREWLNSILDGDIQSIELPLQHFDGSYSWFELAGTDMRSDPDISGIVLNVRDISDRKAAEDRLQKSEARFKALVQNSTDLVVAFDHTHTITYASPSVMALSGLSADEVTGSTFDLVFPHNDLDAVLSSGHGAVVDDNLVEFHFTDPYGVRRTVESTITDLSTDPAIAGIVINARDVTERRSMQEQILYQATHDELTGLANRPNALSTLRSVLAKNSGRTTVALILFDIDDLREVNDSLGHAVGDQILVEFSRRLGQLLGPGDLVARVAGDEFLVMVERSLGEDEIMDLAYEMRSFVSDTFTIEGREISISVSTGLAFDHDRTNTAELMLRNADTAMHRSKPGRNSDICVFEPHMHTATFDRLELRADLARAIAHNQFEAFYQPIIDLETSRIIGAEALVRWRHPHRGLLGPNLFIPLAEETGMINAIGEWMLRRATTDLATWIEDLPAATDEFTISVNLSPEQLHDGGLVDSIEEILRRTSLPATRLVLEVTESTLITESVEATRVMAMLRDRGIKLSIDDFGTGYSSLGYIQQFEFDILKIDKSFIDHVTTGTNQRIVETIIDLAENLGVKTVAEGIEEEDQRAVLTDLGCRFGQGYLFSRPVPEAEFRELLSNGTGTTESTAQSAPPPAEVHAENAMVQNSAI